MRKQKIHYLKAGFQISVMIIAIISFAYFAHEDSYDKTNSENPFLEILRFITKIIGDGNLVSAESMSTCIKSNDGKICQEYITSECDEQCEQACIPSESSGVAECKKGICYDAYEGTCGYNSPKIGCEQNDGVWFEANANPPECRKGCCVLGGMMAEFVTEQACTMLSERAGMQKNFRKDITKILDCINLPKAQEEGACMIGTPNIISKRNCVFRTRAMCSDIQGEFYAGILCTNDNLNSTCTIPSIPKTSCIGGRDEVYFLDSCGNRANIYDVNKVSNRDYWNRIFSKTESCSVKSGGNMLARQGTCGNCEYMGGSICGNKTSTQHLDDTLQKVVCRDLNCIDDAGNKRYHGDSWCVYQGRTGLDSSGLRAMDTVGSNHFMRVCWEGEVITNPCEEARKQICVEIRNSTGSVTKSNAACVTNSGLACITYKSGTKCEANPDCFFKDMNIDDPFSFNICLPRHPQGGDADCSIATQTCIKAEVKEPPNDWNCVANCDHCQNRESFTVRMNDLCISLGDCGAKANYIGKMSSSYSIKRAPKLSDSYLNKVKDFAKTSLTDYIDAYRQTDKPNLLFASELGVNKGDLNDYESYSTKSVKETMDQWQEILTWQGDHSTSTRLFMMFFFIFFSQILLFTSWLAPQLWDKWFGWGRVRERKVRFTCDSWEAPTGGEDCEKCGNIDGLPCNSYSCGSLGQNCIIVNKDTDNVKCVNNDDRNVNPAVISPLQEVLTEGYQYINNESDPRLGVRIRNITGECISSYQTLTFGIKMDRYAKCKYSVYPGVDYDDMENQEEDENSTMMQILNGDYFGDEDFLTNHSKTIVIPPLEMLGRSSLDPNATLDYNFYVKCKTTNDVVNVADYNINLCIKPGPDNIEPDIARVEPVDGIVAYNATVKDVIIFVSEPSDCKFDSVDKNYSLMKYNFNCIKNFDSASVYEGGIGWMCNATMSVGANETKYYARCLDKPWEGNESNRNEMSMGREIKLIKTDKLEITSASPDNETFVYGVEPIAIKLEVRTKGGDEETTNCYYSLDGEHYNAFYENKGHEHNNLFSSIFGGEHKFMIRCTDRVGNSIEKNISFKVELDVQQPKITRIYQAQGDLIIKTDEKASCAVSLDECNFNFENGTLMSGTEYYHSIPSVIKTIYYVKCKDIFDNFGGDCDAKLKIL